MKRFALVLALICALTAGFGCAKKQQAEPAPVAYDDGIDNEKNAAVQQITDGRVYFAFDKYSLLPEGKEVLKNKAELMKRFPSIRVRIEGNCDERGTQEYNLALGERRAHAAQEFLTTLGVNPSQMETISFGKENPAVQGSGEAVWQQNRRDDFRVIAQ
ncbi:MAG: peptidoglycan-associated lipoprotein Pal [Desulfovibrionaceae bacterium]|nr:peptidoglycan-associated lipoprotein Pal [Desulfovibrionaceae bacterium]